MMASTTNETWRGIADYPGYEVSDLGRIRRSAPAKTRPAGSILSTKGLRSGYPSVDLCREGAKRTYSVHRLVAAAFLGPCPDGHEVNHINGRKTDASVVNLEYVSRAENLLHAYRSGLHSAKGERNGQAKLTELQAQEIRGLAKLAGESHAQTCRRLAGLYGVSAATIANIRKGRRWVHAYPGSIGGAIE